MGFLVSAGDYYYEIPYPLNFKLPVTEIESIHNACEPSVLFWGSSHVPNSPNSSMVSFWGFECTQLA